MIYQIRLSGSLPGKWSKWFDGLTITNGSNGETLITGSVADQAALHGLLKQIRDIGMPLISINRLYLEKDKMKGEEE